MTIKQESSNWVKKVTQGKNKVELCLLFEKVRSRKNALLMKCDSYEQGFFNNADLFYEYALIELDKKIYLCDHATLEFYDY
jgi:hypothetical protein